MVTVTVKRGVWERIELGTFSLQDWAFPQKGIAARFALEKSRWYSCISFFSRNFSFLLQDCKAPLPAPNSESQNEQICKLTNNVLSWAEKFTFFISLNPPKISKRVLLLQILQTRSSEKFSKLPKVTQQWAIELELDPRLVWPQTQLSFGPISGPLVWDAEGWVLILALLPNQSPLHTVSSLSGPQFPHLYKEKWISQDGISSSFLLRHVWFLFS